MSSLPFPVSVRNKASKFTLTKRDNSKNKSGQKSTFLNYFPKNIQLNYPSDFSKYKQQKPIPTPKSNNSNALNSSKNKNTLNQTRKDFVHFNKDFLQFYKQITSLKKTSASTNRTAYDMSLEKEKEKDPLFKTIYGHSLHQSKKKLSKEKKPNDKSTLQKTIRVHTVGNDTKNFIPNKLRNKTINTTKVLKKPNPKKNFNNFKPFHIQFTKPTGTHNIKKKTIPTNFTKKNAHIMTYQLNIQKLKSTSKQNYNKTQEIQNKTNICSKKNPSYDSYKNVNTTSNNNNNYLVNFVEDEDKINYQFDEGFSGDETETENDGSGVLAYDEVKDIIIYFDMSDINKNTDYLFTKDEREIFAKKKSAYLNFFGFDDENGCKIKKANKSPSTNASSLTKNNYMSIIKTN